MNNYMKNTDIYEQLYKEYRSIYMTNYIKNTDRYEGTMRCHPPGAQLSYVGHGDNII